MRVRQICVNSSVRRTSLTPILMAALPSDTVLWQYCGQARGQALGQTHREPQAYHISARISVWGTSNASAVLHIMNSSSQVWYCACRSTFPFPSTAGLILLLLFVPFITPQEQCLAALTSYPAVAHTADLLDRVPIFLLSAPFLYARRRVATYRDGVNRIPEVPW